MIDAQKYKQAVFDSVKLIPGFNLKLAMELPGFDSGVQFENEKVRLIDELIVEGKIVKLEYGQGFIKTSTLLLLADQFITLIFSASFTHNLFEARCSEDIGQLCFMVYPKKS